MTAKELAKVIDSRADECDKSATSNPIHAEVFNIVGIVLRDLALHVRNIEGDPMPPAGKMTQDGAK